LNNRITNQTIKNIFKNKKLKQRNEQKKQKEKAGDQKDQVSHFIVLAYYSCDYDRLLLNLLELRVLKSQVP
jgi:hypothetical protein